MLWQYLKKDKRMGCGEFQEPLLLEMLWNYLIFWNDLLVTVNNDKKYQLCPPTP